MEEEKNNEDEVQKNGTNSEKEGDDKEDSSTD